MDADKAKLKSTKNAEQKAKVHIYLACILKFTRFCPDFFFIP